MGIQAFPAALQPIIQQNMLEREFRQALRSRLAFRAIAKREKIPIRIGETITKTRAGLRPAVTIPLSAASNTNLDNGLTPMGSWGVEQYVLTMNQYAASNDLNMVTDRVGLAGQFLQNAYANGEQAARSLDDLARNALFNAYMGGSTRVRVTLGAPGTALTVDDVRGFQTVTTMAVGGSATGGAVNAVSGGAPLSVLIGSNLYTVTGVAVDGTNVSTAIAVGGISGVLTTSGNVTVLDGTAANLVQAQAIAPVVNAAGVITTAGSTPMSGNILRPSGRLTTAGIQATDVLTMSILLDAVAKLRLNNVPDVDGAFNCYLDPVSARQLFSDPDFKQLFQGATSAVSAFQKGMVSDFLGLRFMPTTEVFVQAHPSLAGAFVRRPIIVGAEALVEGTFAGQDSRDVTPADSIINVIDDVVMVTREPIDRLQQIIAQSWYWMGGYAVPSDTTVNSVTLPTSQMLAYKRAVTIEHIG